MAILGKCQMLARAVELESRHIRQVGGRGTFGIVVMRFEPLLPTELAAWDERRRAAGRKPDANGLYFDDQSRNALPVECVEGAEYGFRDAAACGAAYPLPFIRVLATLLGGKYHDVGMYWRGFPPAAAQCFREAQAQAGVVVGELVMRLTVEVPEGALASVEAEILRRRGSIMDFGPGSQAGWATISAAVPEAEAPPGGDLSGFPANVTFRYFAPVEPGAAGLPVPGDQRP